MDEEGYLILAGRKKEIIIRGGQNIYPKEIEDVLLTHPGVMQAVVIRIPDPVMGERACACITTCGKITLRFEEMVSFLKEKGLAVHKLPERLEVLDTLPLLVEGQKVDKMALEKRILERMAAEERVG
jgi:non-ribosomal peptide synthetase component E (peptide arylation enzyme)